MTPSNIKTSTQRLSASSSPGLRGAPCDQPPQRSSSSSSEQPLNLPPPGLQTTDDRQTARHVLLCLLLFVSLLAVSSEGPPRVFCVDGVRLVCLRRLWGWNTSADRRVRYPAYLLG